MDFDKTWYLGVFEVADYESKVKVQNITFDINLTIFDIFIHL